MPYFLILSCSEKEAEAQELASGLLKQGHMVNTRFRVEEDKQGFPHSSLEAADVLVLFPPEPDKAEGGFGAWREGCQTVLFYGKIRKYIPILCFHENNSAFESHYLECSNIEATGGGQYLTSPHFFFKDERENGYLERILRILPPELKNEANIRTEANAFVRDAIKPLESRAEDYYKRANRCYLFSGLTLVVAVSCSGYRWYNGSEISLTINGLGIIVVFGIIAVGLVLALSKFLFTLGRSYMTEYLRCQDRIHAIRFGEFYLNAFGGPHSKWDEIKEAFQDWNIDRGRYFSDQKTSDFDPKMVETIAKISEILSKSK